MCCLYLRSHHLQVFSTSSEQCSLVRSLVTQIHFMCVLESCIKTEHIFQPKFFYCSHILTLSERRACLQLFCKPVKNFTVLLFSCFHLTLAADAGGSEGHGGQEVSWLFFIFRLLFVIPGVLIRPLIDTWGSTLIAPSFICECRHFDTPRNRSCQKPQPSFIWTCRCCDKSPSAWGINPIYSYAKR